MKSFEFQIDILQYCNLEESPLPLHFLAAKPPLLTVDTSSLSLADPSSAIIDIIQNEIHYMAINVEWYHIDTGVPGNTYCLYYSVVWCLVFVLFLLL